MNMRRDARRHDTVAVQRHQGARTDELWAYRPDERVQTIDGPGRVVAVYDGPFQGAEEYEIVLEGGLGGGRYDSGQIMGTAPSTTASTVHTADQDYPELGTILYDRPDPAKLTYTAAKTPPGWEGSVGPFPDEYGLPHVYARDVHSGAGNCVCGATPRDGLHVQASQQYDDPDKVYLRFGKWPEDERSQNNVTGHREEGVSVYDLDSRGNPSDPDPHMSRGHHHDEYCEEDCDADEWNDEFSNDTREEMEDRKSRAEWNRRNGRDLAADTAHLVKGDLVGFGHDDEPLIQNVKRVGDWIDHRHHFIPGADRHSLARGEYDEDYEPPTEVPAHRKTSHLVVDPKPQGHCLSTLITTAAMDPSFGFHVTAAWADVRAKAKRIRSQGGVQITHASDAMVVGNVKGDHNVYETGLQRLPGRRQSVASYSCGCKWGAYHWGAEDDLSRFAGRMCSHALALQYEAASRGMFGRDLTVDEAKPQWVPSKVVVKYDIDSGQHVRAEASLRSVPEQSPFMVALASFYDDPEGLFQVQAAVNDLLGDGTGRSEPNVQPALSPTSPPNPNENPATAGPLATDQPRNWGSIEHDRIFPRFSTKHEAFWQALIPLVRAVAPQVIKTVGPQLVQNQMEKHPAKPAGEVTVPDGTEATLHDEPEGALPETDGEDHEASLGDGNLTGGGGIGSVEPDPLERTGSMWDVEVAHGDNISALEDDTLSPNDQSVQTVGSKSASDIVAEFQKSAGAQALMGSSTRTAAAFSASERDSLINEAPGTQARNTDKLDIEGTHYALLQDEEEDESSWLA